MPTKRELTLGGAGLGSLAGLAYGLRTSAGFWSTWGYSIVGGFMGNMAGTAVGHLTGAADPDKGTEPLQLSQGDPTVPARRTLRLNPELRTLARAARPDAVLGDVPANNW